MRACEAASGQIAALFDFPGAGNTKGAVSPKNRTTAPESASDIRRRPGTLAEVAAIAPTHPLDILVGAWRAQAQRCKSCGR